MGERGASVSAGPRGVGATLTQFGTRLAYVWRKRRWRPSALSYSVAQVLTGHAPFLVVPNVGETLAYYRDALGFEVRGYEHAPEDNGTAVRDGCTIFFNRGPRAAPNSQLTPPDLFDVYLWTDDVRALDEEFRSRGADVLHEPTERPWGMLEIRVRDPNGYVLGFGQPLD